MRSGLTNPVAASTSANKAKKEKRDRAQSNPTEDRRPSQLDTPFEELDVEIRPPPLWLRGSREDLSLVLDDVVAADDLIAIKAVAAVVEVDLRCLAQQGSVHFANDLAIFLE